MAKKDAYYFSHDSNAQDDPKCMLLIDQLGMEGYGIFWALIERLRNEKDYKLPVVLLNAFAKRWFTSKEKVESVVKNYGLFIIEDNYFFSERLKCSMLEKTEKARLSASYRWKDANALQLHNGSNANGMRKDANKGKESKVKEKKRESMAPPVENTILLRGEVFYNAEELILKNPIAFEQICMKKYIGLGVDFCKLALRKYHLYLEEKEQYPKTKVALFAGFEKWLINEKKSNNGITEKHSPGRNIIHDEL